MRLLFTEEDKELFKQAQGAWGREAQVRLCQEKCAELITEVGRYMRHYSGNVELAGAAAEAVVMIAQLMQMNVGPTLSQGSIDRAMKRLKDKVAAK